MIEMNKLVALLVASIILISGCTQQGTQPQTGQEQNVATGASSPDNSIESCEKKVNDTDTGDCVATFAKASKDYSICSKLKKELLKYGCLMTIAIEKKEINGCEMIPKDFVYGETNLNQFCVNSVNGDPECEGSPARNNCYTAKAVETKNMKYCDNINFKGVLRCSQGDFKLYGDENGSKMAIAICKALVSSKTSYCNELGDIKIIGTATIGVGCSKDGVRSAKNDCLTEVAFLTNNQQVCSEIKDFNEYNECVELLKLTN
ncbi:MAG TPA: hypothetical protein VJH23_02125 [archaeon]|nr:hypothetical protein [archaeon]